MTKTTLEPKYTGTGSALFPLAFKTGLLTILTLGIYRFWQKTRIRKYVWASTTVDGDGFEYTGTGLEKLLGFLLAVIILAVYLGLVQMILSFLGLTVFLDPEAADVQQIVNQIIAIYITLLAVLPLGYYAQYRARRYKMARTRWRGIRFGMDHGAWGYTLRAVGYFLLTVVSLGLLTPLMTFKLEKYMADRSYFGSEKFQQHGKWTKLYPAMIHMIIGVVILLAGGVMGAINADSFGTPSPLSMILLFVGYIWFFVGGIIYFVRSFAYMTSHKSLGALTFSATPKAGTVIKHYVLGGLAIGLILGIAAMVIGGIVAALAAAVTSGASVIAFVAFVALLYLFILVLAQALSLVMIVQPVVQHLVETTRITNADALNDIQQRSADSGVDAEGFADALDVGAAL